MNDPYHCGCNIPKGWRRSAPWAHLATCRIRRHLVVLDRRHSGYRL